MFPLTIPPDILKVPEDIPLIWPSTIPFFIFIVPELSIVFPLVETIFPSSSVITFLPLLFWSVVLIEEMGK